MSTRAMWTIGTLAALATARASFAQPAATAIRPPRPIGPIVARSAVTFGALSRVMTLKGSVIANEIGSRRLLLLDSSLVVRSVVLDSSASGIGGRWYGTDYGEGLHRFRGDSAFWATPNDLQAVIIGPEGQIARITPMPARFTPLGQPCPPLDVDNTGWLTCQQQSPSAAQLASPRRPVNPPRDTSFEVTSADTTRILAVNFTTWDVDTLARALGSATGARFDIKANTTSGWTLRYIFRAPMGGPVDEWAMFRDGTLAMVRGTDYHVDIIAPDRAVTRGVRIPFAWRRITEQEQRQLADSLERSDSLYHLAQIRRVDSIVAAGGRATLQPPPLRVAPSEWPSYWPAFRRDAVSIDDDDRIWVRELLAPEADTTQVYAVIDKRGQLIDRVAIPRQYTLRGFGPGGAIYLSSVDAGRHTLLRARFR